MAGAALLAVGAVTARRAGFGRELPFALIPALFGIQQLLEGGIWLAFAEPSALPDRSLVLGYSFFSQVFWPIYLPVAILLMEPLRWRRLLLKLIALAGGAVGLYLLYLLTQVPVVAQLSGRHIAYVFPHYHVLGATALYLLSTCTSSLLSSHPTVRLFGVATLVSLLVAYTFYAAWFISVWCLFAALLSVVVLMHFPARDDDVGLRRVLA